MPRVRVVCVADGREVDIDYFVEWRPYLWGRPVAWALKFLGDLRGRRVLEVGDRYGKITSLFALLGAHATIVERDDLACARAEVAKWGVTDRVRLIQTDGSLREIAGEWFDVLFTESVLYGVADLGPFLDRIGAHLIDGGKAAFIENVCGGAVRRWVRFRLFHRRKNYAVHGITPGQLPLFAERFDGLVVRWRLAIVYTILGRKRTKQGASDP